MNVVEFHAVHCALGAPMQLEELLTPTLLIHLDRVDANLRRMHEILEGRIERWRPHVKTTKIPEVLDRLLAAGVRSFKCATTKEAWVLLARAVEPIDLLVAMPHHGANLKRIAELARAYPRHRLSILTEDADHAQAVQAVEPSLGLFLDLNPGYDRTGMPLSASRRLEVTLAAARPVLCGLHFYDGHIRDEDPAVREQQCHRLYAGYLAWVEQHGLGELELITSGTPTFGCALSYSDFARYRHRISPGTVVYFDKTSQSFGLEGFEYAATVLSRVISHPRNDRITLDAGSKALDAASGSPCAFAPDWPGLQALEPSEEHLPMQVVEGTIPEPGRLIELVPRHVCPTVNLAESAALLDHGVLQGVVSVAARSHESLPTPLDAIAASSPIGTDEL